MTKQATLMWRSIVLSLVPQLVFPDLSIDLDEEQSTPTIESFSAVGETLAQSYKTFYF